ncbi:DnaB-like helicase N-terminal domain-containing protein [Streptomyces sp. NPDC051994]|uniref:DnaB-like helicase N-terminal domain-containing protein n=1 Tax=unclassified Streptomyces TaxID=2593676 RepID=UPI00342632DA
MENVHQIPMRPTVDDDALTPTHVADPGAERAVLANCMHNPDQYGPAAAVITTHDFTEAANRLIWDVLGDLIAQGAPTTSVAVRAAIERLGQLRQVGGGDYVFRIAGEEGGGTAEYYAHLVREKARLRRIDELAIRLRASVLTGSAAPDDLEGVVAGFARQASAGQAGEGGLAGRLLAGGTFILDRPDTVPALWGYGEQVLWAEGEALLIAGPSGVGKTTVAQQVILAAIGVHPGPVLGLPVRRFKRVLYLASDRPQQAARSMARMVRPEDRELLDERLVFWPGPPPSDFIKDPGILLRLCQLAGADAVVLDSLKDMAGELASEEGGQAINSAIQRALVEGIEVIGLHHHRKQGGGKDGGKEATSLDELYGSTWITAGAGSVLSLWGSAGEPIVSMRHLKQPAGECGPWKLRHDHPKGRTEVWHQVDILALLKATGSQGLTPAALAVNLYPNPKSKPTTSEVEKARRRLEQYVEQGLAVQRKTGPSRTAPVAYFAAFNEQGELITDDDM